MATSRATAPGIEKPGSSPSWTAWPPPRWPRPRRSAPTAAASGPGPWRTTATCCPRAPATWAGSPAAWLPPGPDVPDRDPDQDRAERDLDRPQGQRGHRGRPGRVVAGSEHGDRDHDGQGHQPAEHEGRAFTVPRAEGSTMRKAVSGNGSSATARPISIRLRTSTVPPLSPGPPGSRGQHESTLLSRQPRRDHECRGLCTRRVDELRICARIVPADVPGGKPWRPAPRLPGQMPLAGWVAGRSGNDRVRTGAR